MKLIPPTNTVNQGNSRFQLPSLNVDEWEDQEIIQNYVALKLGAASRANLETALRKLHYFMTVRLGYISMPSIKSVTQRDAASFISWLGDPPVQDCQNKQDSNNQRRYHGPDGQRNPHWRPLRKPLSLGSTKSIVRALHGLWKFAKECQFIDSSVWETIRVQNIPPFNEPDPIAYNDRSFPLSAIYLVLQYVNRPEESESPTVKGATQRWLIWLYLMAPGRVSEIAMARSSQIVWNSRDSAYELKLITKGRKKHTLPWGVLLQREFNRYRAILGPEREASSPETDYLVKHLYRMRQDDPVERSTVYRRITETFRGAARWSEDHAVGYPEDREVLRVASPHWLRHGALTALLNDAGVPVDVVRSLANHSDIRITQGYLHHDSKRNNAAAEAMSRLLQGLTRQDKQ